MSLSPHVRHPLPALVAGLSLVALFTGVTTSPAHAVEETTINGVTYSLRDSADPSQGALAVEYTPSDNPGHPHLTLPSTVEIDGESVPVVEVENSAFRGYALQSVTVPGSVRTIGNFAFAYNTGLASVTLTEGLEHIGNGAFRSNYTLDMVDLPETLTHLGPQAFFDNALTSIDVPSAIDTLQIGVFGRNNLTELELQPHVTHVRERAFAENSLASVAFHAGVVELGEGVFTDNPDLETVRFLGPEPAIVNQGTTTSGDGNPISIDAETSPTIEFLWRHGAAQGDAGGFTWPTWWGFTTVPIAEVVFSHAEGDVHAAQWVALTNSTADGPWGLVEPADIPEAPTRDGYEFAAWLDVGSPWTTDTAITGDLALSSAWIDLSWVYTVALTATPTDPTVGDQIELRAEGFNVRGDSLGDITDEFIFDDPADPRVTLAANRVEFAQAGTYTLTGWHAVTESAATLEIEVGPAADPVSEEGPSAGESAEPSVASDDVTARELADSGPESAAWSALLALLALVGGFLLIARERRNNTPMEAAL